MANLADSESANSPPAGGLQSDGYARRLPRRRFVNDMPDKGLFGFVAVFGFVVIIALKLNGYHANLVAGTAVALMLGYGLVAYRMPQVQLRLDRLGDNFYYLGFIFTLASMSAALLQLGENANNIDAVLGSFGIALFTTIVSVAGRVMFVQLRSEIDEVEAEVRRELVETSDALRAQLHQSLREFETFAASAKQAANEHVAQSSEAARKQIEVIASAAQAAAAEIESAFSASRESSKNMDRVVKEAASAVQHMVQHVTNLQVPAAKMDEQMTAFGKGLQSVLSQLAQKIDEIQHSSGERPRKRRWWRPWR